MCHCECAICNPEDAAIRERGLCRNQIAIDNALASANLLVERLLEVVRSDEILLSDCALDLVSPARDIETRLKRLKSAIA
jgi:hypothetical protein